MSANAVPLSFQQVILKLHEFWAAQGCIIWEPYNVQVGAGTGNPATLLRVLGPEPWRVAYTEPSVRPDDGRYGENPNRMQKYYQYQVILKPDPGNPQELYLGSLEALGLDPRQHDIRFVEDNWESPALGAWGLGWEVWLDGQEITQFTYFQQAGGLELNPVSVEITYGVERIVLALQGKNSAWEIDWLDGVQYRDLMLQDEIEHSRYYFDVADVDALRLVYETYEREYARALEGDALISAYDYVLKCSHLFNVLDTRGAIGVTERATYFKRMRDMTRTIAKTYAAQREALGHPLLKMAEKWAGPAIPPLAALPAAPAAPADFLLEIGVEELPPQDVDSALEQLNAAAPALFASLNLAHDGLAVYATPRRLVVHVRELIPRQPDTETVEKGPSVKAAYDAGGKPTKAAEGFARGRGVALSDLYTEDNYVMARVHRAGRPTPEVLAEALPGLIAGVKFGKSMRWNASNVACARPLRWYVALYGQGVIPFEYAGVTSGATTRGIRPYGSPEIAVSDPAAYFAAMEAQGVLLDIEARAAAIKTGVEALAASVGGRVPEYPGLLEEVVNLVERPTALLGTFDADSLALPRDILITVMRDKQRYFAVEGADGKLLPYFITVRNGDDAHLETVAHGNEHVLRARFADARFFYNEDIRLSLADTLPRLDTLTFEEHLGSMLDKNKRVAGLVSEIGALIGADAADIAVATEAGALVKADLATRVVVEMTSLQGVMGREYARLSGKSDAVADAIFEHWQPRFSGDAPPAGVPGTLLALTDRLDSLVGLFAAGLAPKSTADPYGLRRAALGIIQIVTDKGIDLDLTRAVLLTAKAQPIEVSVGARAQVLEFIAGRLRVWLGEQGWATDGVNAVLAEQSANPYRALLAVRELSAWVARDDWANILDNFARCVRITRAEAERFELDPALLAEPQERALYDAYAEVNARLKPTDGVDAFLTAFAPMVPAVAAFFDHVLVNAEDAAVRRNRLGLLQAISALQKGRADLSQLSGF
jgi:glycyl-tRNA synthetase